MKKTVLFTALLLMFWGCSSQELPELSGKEKKRFQQSYTALLQLQYELGRSMPVPRDSILSVCNRFELDSLAYDKAMAYYQAHPEKWRRFYQKAVESLEEQETRQP